MKLIISTFIVLCSTLMVAAQTPGPGVWKAPAGQELQLDIKKDGSAILIIEDEARFTGAFSRNGKYLKFKNSQGVLHLRKIEVKGQKIIGRRILTFQTKSGPISYEKTKGNIQLPAWSKGDPQLIVIVGSR